MAQECEEDIKTGKEELYPTNKACEATKKNYFGNQTMTFKNSNEDVIYEAVADTNDSSYLVSLDQIYDVVGEED